MNFSPKKYDCHAPHELDDFILQTAESYFLGKSNKFLDQIFENRQTISDSLGAKDGLWVSCMEDFKTSADEYRILSVSIYQSKSVVVLTNFIIMLTVVLINLQTY